MDKISLPILKEIKNNSICFICYKYWNNKIFHRGMFPSFSTKINKIKENKESLNKIVNIYNKSLRNILKNNSNNLIKQEIEYSLAKNNLLLQSFDIEANKLNPERKLPDKLPNYDFFSKKIYGINSKDIKKVKTLPKCNTSYLIKFSEYKLKKLILIAKGFFDKIQFKIGEYPNFAVDNFTIKIPKKEEYNLQEIITLFFHEMTHFIRFYNMKQNLGFIYKFYDSNQLEEGLALYNEYFYGNQITNYGNYYPYYHKVYNILMEKQSIEDKFYKMYKILSCKGFSKKKTKKYFWRFYRFTPLGGEKFIFKEAIYYNSYNTVIQLLKEGVNLDYLMSMKGGINTINYFFQGKNINYNLYKKYFDLMVKEIKNLI